MSATRIIALFMTAPLSPAMGSWQETVKQHLRVSSNYSFLHQLSTPNFPAPNQNSSLTNPGPVFAGGAIVRKMNLSGYEIHSPSRYILK
jgi:hypothetical protein